MESMGIDVQKVNSQICVVGENTEVLEERMIQTDREQFAAVLGKRPKARVLIEASTESEWVARCLEELGHEVIVADPNFAPMDIGGGLPPGSVSARAPQLGGAETPAGLRDRCGRRRRGRRMGPRRRAAS